MDKLFQWIMLIQLGLNAVKSVASSLTLSNEQKRSTAEDIVIGQLGTLASKGRLSQEDADLLASRATEAVEAAYSVHKVQSPTSTKTKKKK